MKIDSVELHPDGSSEVVVMSFRDPSRLNPYNVRDISGLDAQDIVPRYYAGSGSSAKYNMTLEKREPIIRIEMNPRYELGENPSTLRDALYRMIASSRTGMVQMQFKNASVIVAAVSGYISKVEQSHFEKSQEIQITLTCRDPILRGITPVEIDIFPLDTANTLIEDYLSTAPHGFAFEIGFLAPVASLSIDDPNDSSWSFDVSPAGGFLTDDVLHFSSEYNNLYLYLVRGEATIHLGDKIAPNSVWPILFPGENRIAFSSPTSVYWISIEYLPAYWGV